MRNFNHTPMAVRMNGWATGAAVVVLAFVCLAVAPQLQAEERVIVPMEVMEINHSDDVKIIQLRNEIRKLRGEIDSERYELAYISILAKSRNNNGRAWIGIDQIEGEVVKIDGSEAVFKDESNESFDRVRVPVPSPKHMTGRWSLNLKGRLKIRRIIIGLNDCGKGECRIQQVETRRVIPLDDSEVRVPDSERIIDLRRLVQNYDGDIRLNDASLIKVEVLIKMFERDGGVVRLAPHAQKPVQTSLTGNRNNYRNRADESFTRIELSPNDSAKTRGAWDLILRKGTFRLREIAVTTVDRAYWRADGKPLAPAGEEEKKEEKKKAGNGKKNQNAGNNNCNRDQCRPSRRVQSRATGPLSCYASGDGRQIDRRDGAKMTYIQGCADGTCMKSTETCYESRTCKCSDGSGRCKDKSSCSSGNGCKNGYVSLKFHCPSGIFDG